MKAEKNLSDVNHPGSVLYRLDRFMSSPALPRNMVAAMTGLSWTRIDQLVQFGRLTIEADSFFPGQLCVNLASVQRYCAQISLRKAQRFSTKSGGLTRLPRRTTGRQ